MEVGQHDKTNVSSLAGVCPLSSYRYRAIVYLKSMATCIWIVSKCKCILEKESVFLKD